MNARFAHVLSRLSIVTVASASAVGAAACARGAPAPSSTEPTAAAAEPQAAAPQAAAASQHRPGGWLFDQVEGLDLRADQRAAMSDIQQNLAADLAPHREAMRQITLGLADAVERGQLDEATAAEHRAALVAAVGDAKASFANAINAIHDTLDAGQRAALVEKLQQQHDGHAQRTDGAAPKHGLARLAYELGLSEEQQAQIHDAFQKGVDELFPDRAARRAAHEAKMKAMAAAFVTDDFDAADYDLAEHAEEAIASFVAITSKAVDLSGSVLSDDQRKIAADLIRARAEKL